MIFDRLYSRYVAASVVSLGVDFTVFISVLALGVWPAPAAACGYAAGILSHWLLSTRAVFVGRVAEGMERRHQQALFVGSALVGLAITTAIVGLGSRLGVDPRIAKIVAVGASFQVTYVLRKKVVFA